MEFKVLLLPGLGGSGPSHWQSFWVSDHSICSIVEQTNWDKPLLKDWLQGLAVAIPETGQPYVLVAHSLGCTLAAHWFTFASTHSLPLPAFVMMVAPADVECTDRTPEETRNFGRIPIDTLPCRSVVIASSNDPYVSIDRAKYFADRWGSSFYEIGPAGHINHESGLGRWEQGKEFVSGYLDPGHEKKH